MVKRACAVAGLLWLSAAGIACAQDIVVPIAVTVDDAALAAAMPEVARRAIAASPADDSEKSLDDRFRLQLVAGRYADAVKTLAALRERRRAAHSPVSPFANLAYEVYARARVAETADGLSSDDAFARAYRELVGGLDDATAAHQAPYAFGTSVRRLEANLRDALEGRGENAALPLPAAIDLVRRYLAVQVYRSIPASLAALQQEDDRRRYAIDADVAVRTPDGATVCVLVMRPRAAAARLPALLNFSIYADANHRDEARLSAAHGYAGVSALTRGKGCSPDTPVPIEHDGADADAVIDWISRQPWSDGRVGMFGGSYDGFTQWAAAKHMPKALKALMPSVTFAPGIDFPMDGNIFMNYAYPWPFYTTDVKGLDDAVYFDSGRWDRLNREWYAGGRAYRDLDAIDGTPNPVFDRWLRHPSYDAYWQGVMPYKGDFAKIDIPVLTTTGYYDSGQIGALYYFANHAVYSRAPDHYLVVGPYDHIRGQRGTISPLGSTLDTLRGYTLDAAAQIDILALRYAWFDYVLLGGAKPAVLRDNVNYEVMDANVWKHAPSLRAMAGGRLRLHLSNARRGGAYRLSERAPPSGAFIAQSVDLADRTDADRAPAGGANIDQALDTWNIVDTAPHIAHALEFDGEPLAAATEVSGLFSGQLDVVTNKRDFDFGVTLFERTVKGEYVQLSYTWARASYVGDRSHRRLLEPGRRRRLGVRSGRLTSKMLHAGSRLVVVLAVIKQPGEQIDYGTGKGVSDETIADAKEPLRIRWYGDSFIDVPVAR